MFGKISSQEIFVILFTGMPYKLLSDVCDLTLSVYIHTEQTWKIYAYMPGHGGNRTYDLWNTSPTSQTSYSPEYITPRSQTSYSPEYITPTQKNFTFCLFLKKSTSVLQVQIVLCRDWGLSRCVAPYVLWNWHMQDVLYLTHPGNFYYWILLSSREIYFLVYLYPSSVDGRNT